jgi:hypothetical protein
VLNNLLLRYKLDLGATDEKWDLGKPRLDAMRQGAEAQVELATAAIEMIQGCTGVADAAARVAQ